jgi:hypothetical protein
MIEDVANCQRKMCYIGSLHVDYELPYLSASKTKLDDNQVRFKNPVNAFKFANVSSSSAKTWVVDHS